MIVSYRVIIVKIQKVDVRVQEDICIELLPVSGSEKSVQLRSELCEVISLRDIPRRGGRSLDSG